MSLDELVRGVDVGDVRALNESDKQISPYLGWYELRYE